MIDILGWSLGVSLCFSCGASPTNKAAVCCFQMCPALGDGTLPSMWGTEESLGAVLGASGGSGRSG